MFSSSSSFFFLFKKKMFLLAVFVCVCVWGRGGVEGREEATKLIHYKVIDTQSSSYP